jgi:hypothetical protein
MVIDSGIISKSNYDKLVREKKVKVLQRACINTPALADFSSFPERFRRVMETVFGDPKAAKSRNALDNYLVGDVAAMEFYSTYTYGDDNKSLKPEVVSEYYANACVLNAIQSLLNYRLPGKKRCNSVVEAHWDTIAENVKALDRSMWPHDLPTHERRLKERYNRYKQNGYVEMVHKNFCNNNSAKVANDAQEALVYRLFGDPRNFDDQQVCDFYNMAAEALSWKTITRPTVTNWRKKHSLETHGGRRGTVDFYNRKAMQVKRSAPTAPLYYYTIDGWDVELMYQKFEDGRTTYHHRPTVVVVLDAYCKYPMGYAIGTHETPALIKEALRNAARHSAELFGTTGTEGTMYRAHQLQSDRYAIKAMTPLYEALAKHSTPARAKNAKAKVIEPYFAGVNKKYCQLQPNWSGFGITSNKDKQPNTEYLNKYKHQFPEYDGACEQVVAMMEKERAAKREQMLKAWAGMEADDKLVLTRENYLLNFGETTLSRKNERAQRVTLEPSGLHVTINGVKVSYDSFEIGFRQHAHVRWEIRYDVADLSRVMAINEDGTLRYLLEEKYVQPMALRDRKVGDSGQLQRVKDYNADLERHVIARNEKMVEALAPVLEMLPQLDTLSKLLITDSHGQHKNNRNATRGLAPKSPKGDLVQVAEDVEVMDDLYDRY